MSGNQKITIWAWGKDHKKTETILETRCCFHGMELINQAQSAAGNIAQDLFQAGLNVMIERSIFDKNDITIFVSVGKFRQS